MLRSLLKQITAIVAVVSVLMLATVFAVQKTKDTNIKTCPISLDKSSTKNPVPATPESIKSGKKIYRQNCRNCHGPDAVRDSSCVCRPDFCPADLRDPQIWKNGEGFVFKTVTEGRAPMPRFGNKLSEEQRWDVVNYLHSLIKEKPREEQKD